MAIWLCAQYPDRLASEPCSEPTVPRAPVPFPAHPGPSFTLSAGEAGERWRGGREPLLELGPSSVPVCTWHQHYLQICGAGVGAERLTWALQTLASLNSAQWADPHWVLPENLRVLPSSKV